jgi:hypothetical protein
VVRCRRDLIRRIASIAPLTASVSPNATSKPAPGLGFKGLAAEVLTVTDVGAGIPADQLPHIFDRFWRGRQAFQTSGSGIGLARCFEVSPAVRGDGHGQSLRTNRETGSSQTCRVCLHAIITAASPAVRSSTVCWERRAGAAIKGRGRRMVTAADLLVLVPWLLFAAGLAVIGWRLLASRWARRRRRDGR